MLINLTNGITILMSSSPYNDEIENGIGTGQHLYNLVIYIMAFVFVIALLYIVLKLLKRYSTGLQQSHHMRLLDTLPLDNEKKLLLVEVGNKVLLIGAGKELNLLTSVELNEEELRLIRETGKNSPSFSIASIWDHLKEKLPWNFGESEASHDQEIEHFEQQLQEELEKMRRAKDEGGNNDGER